MKWFTLWFWCAPFPTDWWAWTCFHVLTGYLVYLLWWNNCSNPLAIFKLGCFSLAELYESFIFWILDPYGTCDLQAIAPILWVPFFTFLLCLVLSIKVKWTLWIILPVFLEMSLLQITWLLWGTKDSPGRDMREFGGDGNALHLDRGVNEPLSKLSRTEHFPIRTLYHNVREISGFLLWVTIFSYNLAFSRVFL